MSNLFWGLGTPNVHLLAGARVPTRVGVHPHVQQRAYRCASNLAAARTATGNKPRTLYLVLASLPELCTYGIQCSGVLVLNLLPTHNTGHSAAAAALFAPVTAGPSYAVSFECGPLVSCMGGRPKAPI